MHEILQNFSSLAEGAFQLFESVVQFHGEVKGFLRDVGACKYVQTNVEAITQVLFSAILLTRLAVISTSILLSTRWLQLFL